MRIIYFISKANRVFILSKTYIGILGTYMTIHQQRLLHIL